MNVAELKNFTERQPFRPFTVRLSSGAQYPFSELRNLGAPKDCHIIIYFGESDWTLIDTESITEVMTR